MSIVPRQVRAVRNNNPGNLERNTVEWMGLARPDEMTAEQRAEPRFCVFTHPIWGFRALAILLLGYWQKRGLCTVAQIIPRYAPSNENNTQAYIKSVCDGMGIEPTKVLDMLNADTLKALCRAIAIHESGGWFFSPFDLDDGVTMALKPKSQPAIS